ncbi:MAG: methyltransferase domain-containing protein [Alistipes sp.]|nr:methyltransferase domain-containing protein [Alistipes sp.]
MQLPERFLTRTREQLGVEEAERLFAALDGEQPTSIRLHPLRGVVEGLPIARPIPWSEHGRYLSERPSFTLDPAFHGGAYYVQEASSQFVERLLPAACEGMRVLDLCAAPGGKTTLYASKVGPKGLVVANEIDRKRVQILADNVRKWGMGNVAVTCGDAEMAARMESWYDVVAVDAPCSGEGMFRKDDVARQEWSEQNVRICAERQDEILSNAWRALRAGGTLIYSTCTFNREEDEGTLERFLDWASEEVEAADEVALDADWGIVTGRVGAFQTFRFMPHRAVGEGFFAAVVRKAEDAGSGRLPKAKRSVIAPVDKQSVAELKRWVSEPDAMAFGQAGDTCYGWFKEQAEAVKRLSELVSVVYSGVAMGQLFKGKLKPDQALAHFVGLRREAVPVAELTRAESLCYLRKQEVAAESFAEGMNLVVCQGLPLGFAKRIGGRVNNLYPNVLRILKND